MRISIVGVFAVCAVCACGPRPSPPLPAPCIVPSLAGRSPAMFVRTPVGVSLPQVPDAPVVDQPPRDAPLAWVRVGDVTSRPVIAAVRSGISRNDCATAARAAATLAPSHPDHDYVAYLVAWCDHVRGDDVSAWPKLAALLGRSDSALAPFVVDELIEALARGASVREARSTLETARLWRPPYIDRLAATLYRIGFQTQAALITAEDPASTPETNELRCSRGVARCGAMLHGGPPYELSSCDATPDPVSPTCRHQQQLGMVLALLAWEPRNRRYDGNIIARMARAYRDAVPELRDRVDVVELAARVDEQADWDTLGTDAERLATSTADPDVSAAAREIARVARLDAAATRQRMRCVTDRTRDPP